MLTPPTDAQYESARQSIEALINAEIPLTQYARDFEILTWRRGVIRQSQFLGSRENLTEAIIDSKLDQYPLSEGREVLLRNRGGIYLRSDQPYLLGKGDNQLTVKAVPGIVAKIPRGGKKPCCWEVEARFPEIIPVSYASFPDAQETLANLNELLGSQVYIPPVRFYSFAWNDSFSKAVVTPVNSEMIPNLALTQDLTENGMYKVIDYSEESAKQLINSQELIAMFNPLLTELSKRVISLAGLRSRDRAKGPYIITTIPHGPKDDKELAISHLFLLQVPVDKTQPGRLVLGDWDHIYMFK